ncbi:hypothetical protein FCL47_14645 [Desulfopila sp. IMCC35006]|uniref:hypothetical protein n=1 Tax=Desulfopila sp. IMCC35006 TaxID=2569542 RepID=UPI0010AC8954|nr:hypothetical protein [Desulfopila sp. IMCC35006]TKB25290.1 hypothetical protein FCL47_14645 [Desulfopila sp. IMCC35006]
MIIFGVKGEETKFNSHMVSEDNQDGECLVLDPKMVFKVIPVQYSDPPRTDIAILEVVGEKIKAASDGAFVFATDDLVELVKKPVRNSNKAK